MRSSEKALASCTRKRVLESNSDHSSVDDGGCKLKEKKSVHREHQSKSKKNVHQDDYGHSIGSFSTGSSSEHEGGKR